MAGHRFKITSERERINGAAAAKSSAVEQRRVLLTLPSAIRRQDILPHDRFSPIEHPHGSCMVSVGATQIGKVR